MRDAGNTDCREESYWQVTRSLGTGQLFGTVAPVVGNSNARFCLLGR